MKYMKLGTANVNVSSRIIKMKNKIWPELLGSKVFHQQGHWDFSLKGNFLKLFVSSNML